MAIDSDLLFGRIALRLKFVTRKDLRECAEARMRDPGRSMGQFLVELGYLTEEQHGAVMKALEGEIEAGSDVKPAAPREEPAPAAKPASGERFRIGKELGRGGLGRVVEAEDAEIGRTVALKLVLEGAPLEVVQRFHNEGRLTGRLEHPNIVPVYDVGTLKTAGGGPAEIFYAMKKITGRNLGAVIRSREWPMRRMVEAFRDVCRAMAYAHAKGVIHRDLKPANVMVGAYGEVLVVDWGLARLRSDSPSANQSFGGVNSSRLPGLTLEGDVVGTPEYMSPEQASGKLDEVDERSDIFALGAMLYEVITGRPPFEGRDPGDVLRQAQSGFVTPPSKLATLPARAALPRLEAVPPELEAICMKSLASRKQDRHASARELHDEIQAFLEGSLERERRAKEAKERVAGGRKKLDRYLALRGEIEAQERVCRETLASLRSHDPLEKKRPLWDAEAKLKALRESRIEAFTQADAEFAQALTVDPDSAEAREGKCALFHDRFLDAERKRDREGQLLGRSQLAAYDREGAWRAKLDAPGRLSLRAFVYDCDCLAPRPGMRVAIAEEPAVPWRDGRPRPELALEEKDFPVPAVTVEPAWGHGPGCARRAIAVEVRIAKYEEVERRLVPQGERALGATPLADVELAQGSWLCTLAAPGYAPARVPVLITRGSHWSQDVTLYPAHRVPPGFLFMPGGPYTFGGGYAGGEDEIEKITGDVFVARHPVTCGEYLAFLNSLPLEEARRRQPREADDRHFREKDGRFELRAGEAGALMPAHDYPIVGVSWFDATAFASWKSARDGRPYRLLHDQEFEKALRGVDRRIYPWGDEFDNCFANLSGSNESGPRLLPPGSFPSDVSPYGIEDLAGNAITWCWNTPEKPWRNWCVIRGAGWSHAPAVARGAFKQGTKRTTTYRFLGFRMCFGPASVSG